VRYKPPADHAVEVMGINKLGVIVGKEVDLDSGERKAVMIDLEGKAEGARRTGKTDLRKPPRSMTPELSSVHCYDTDGNCKALYGCRLSNDTPGRSRRSGEKHSIRRKQRKDG